MTFYSKILVGIVFVIFGCKDDVTSTDVPADIPTCVVDQISQIKSQARWNPPAKLFSYRYKGQTVYFIPQRCCDIPSTLLDANCTILCSPDGGISGGGDGKCTDFFTARTDEKLIWQDSR